MKYVRDPLYGFISIEKPFLEMIDSPEFQRLRRIAQLGFAHLVYPTAIHTRFEHSLGCFYLADKISKKFGCGDEFKAAALLHDIGHAPFSHSAESLIRNITGKSHEDIAVEKIKRNVVDILEKASISAKEVCRLIEGKGLYGKLISGEIDVDRLDYLRRDAYYTGVAYGVTDADVVIKSLECSGKGFCVKTEYTPALESILIARYMMYPTVYNHHTVRIARTMFRKALQKILESIDIEKFLNMDDFDIIGILRNSSGLPKNIMERIDSRRLYKSVLVLGMNKIGDMKKLMKIRSNPKKLSQLETELCSVAGLKEGEVLIDIPPQPEFSESKILVGNKPLSKFSPLVAALAKAEQNFWSVGVYCAERNEGILKKLRNTTKNIF